MDYVTTGTCITKPDRQYLAQFGTSYALVGQAKAGETSQTVEKRTAHPGNSAGIGMQIRNIRQLRMKNKISLSRN